MHHKRGKPKNQRAGCLMCKPQKMNGGTKLKKHVNKVGFGSVRDEAHAKTDLVLGAEFQAGCDGIGGEG